jgi:hypothetical protein
MYTKRMMGLFSNKIIFKKCILIVCFSLFLCFDLCITVDNQEEDQKHPLHFGLPTYDNQFREKSWKYFLENYHPVHVC